VYGSGASFLDGRCSSGQTDNSPAWDFSTYLAVEDIVGDDVYIVGQYICL
jgi:hypothetical protein